jgi:hypothetical protein
MGRSFHLIPLHQRFRLLTPQAQTVLCYINLARKFQKVQLQVRSLHLLHHIPGAPIVSYQFWKIALHKSGFDRLISILEKWELSGKPQIYRGDRRLIQRTV